MCEAAAAPLPPTDTPTAPSTSPNTCDKEGRGGVRTRKSRLVHLLRTYNHLTLHVEMEASSVDLDDGASAGATEEDSRR